MMYIVVPIVNKEGEDADALEPVSVNMSHVADYRAWRDQGGRKRTVFFFKKDVGKSKLIADVDVESVHVAIGAVKVEK